MIGDLVKKIREEKGLSQGALARAAAISNDYMHKIENGKVENIGIKVIESLAEALGVHPSLLLFGKILTPEITLTGPNKIGPPNEDEEAFIFQLRKISRPKAREALKRIMEQLADQAQKSSKKTI